MNGQTRAHTIQTAVIILGILVPVLGAMGKLYSDLSEALKDNARQDTELRDMRKEEKDFAAEIRNTWIDVRRLLGDVQRDTAVAAERMRKK